CFAGTQDGEEDGNGNRGDPATAGDDRALDEYARRIGVVEIPPDEEAPGRIDWPAEDLRHRRAELRLKAETPCGPLCRGPDESDHNERDDNALAPEDPGGLRLLCL